MKKSSFTKTIFFLSLVAFSLLGACKPCNKNTITLEKLLDEMVSFDMVTEFPDYLCLQESSYDRRSVSPEEPGWFANNDGFGIIRTDTINGRFEKVLFDHYGPGVITRIWITTLDKRGTWRFYFDHSTEANWIIPAYDMMQIDIPNLQDGLLLPHTSYSPEGKGGNTLFLPIPYAKACKITFEDELGLKPTPKYYGINYREYPADTKIETLSKDAVQRAKKKIATTNKKLQNPPNYNKDKSIKKQALLGGGQTLSVELPKGENAIHLLEVSINRESISDYDQVMRELVLSIEFDGKGTVWVPIGDFSGAGMGAPYVDSWFLSADGNGSVTSRWVMPYQQSAKITLNNYSEEQLNLALKTVVAPFEWNENTLYFHSAWKQETDIYIHQHPDEDDKCIDWNFANISGRGVYKGDVLTLFNHSPAWYGEGDEKIYVDYEFFPSHFGTGTEDYYNSSWAPVIPFQTPFGGAPRADIESSHAYNTFFRTRNLDGIPFKENIRFDIEMLSWLNGTVDYATTVYWYGDLNSSAANTSKLSEVKRKLMETVEAPDKYKIEDAIEFEDIKPTSQSSTINADIQNMMGFPTDKWSNNSHLLCVGGRPGDYIEFTFDELKNTNYQIVLYATKAGDYGVISFEVNGQKLEEHFDAYSNKVEKSDPIILGNFKADNNKIKLKITIEGTNKNTVGDRYFVGLDCVQLIEI